MNEDGRSWFQRMRLKVLCLPDTTVHMGYQLPLYHLPMENCIVPPNGELVLCYYQKESKMKRAISVGDGCRSIGSLPKIPINSDCRFFIEHFFTGLFKTRFLKALDTFCTNAIVYINYLEGEIRGTNNFFCPAERDKFIQSCWSGMLNSSEELILREESKLKFEKGQIYTMIRRVYIAIFPFRYVFENYPAYNKVTELRNTMRDYERKLDSV